MRWSGCVVLRPFCPPSTLTVRERETEGEVGSNTPNNIGGFVLVFVVNVLYRYPFTGGGRIHSRNHSQHITLQNITCTSTMTTAYDTHIHIEISMPCVISQDNVDLATIATQTTYLREMGISVIILGDAQVQLWHINQHATALMKMFSSTLKTTKSQSLFSNQVHIVTRGVTRATDTTPTPETQAVCRLVDEVCRSVGCGLRVVAQHDNSGQIWLGRRGYMDQNRLEPLFRHIYGTGSPRYTSHAQTRTHT
jgi:hypothetical protein